MADSGETPDGEVLVSLAEIARIASVGRAAVSNWRRRYETFPDPVAGGDNSPLFDLAQVERWLRSTERGAQLQERDLIWPKLEALGERDAAARAIVMVGSGIVGESLAPDGAECADAGADHNAAQKASVEQALAVAQRDGASQTIQYYLDRWHETNIRQVMVTPAPLAALMVKMAMMLHLPSGSPPVVFDPACGSGGLLAMARKLEPRSRVFGQEQDAVLAGLARVRLAVLPPAVPAAHLVGAVRVGDSLRADAFNALAADIVVCNPPYGVRDWGYDDLVTDSRWRWGLPPRAELELAWVQHALGHTAPGGVAVLVVPAGVASRRGGRRIRAALLRSGVLRAVVALPTGSAPPYAVALQLWVFTLSGGQPEPSVVLIDAAAIGAAAAPSDREGRAAGKDSIEWASLTEQVLAALRTGLADGGQSGVGWVCRSVISLLDDDIDLTPARHVSPPIGLRKQTDQHLSRQFLDSLERLQTLTGQLSPTADQQGGEPGAAAASPPLITVGDLMRSRILTLAVGRSWDAEVVGIGPIPDGAVPLLTIAELVAPGRERGWISAETVDLMVEQGRLVLAEPGDVVVAVAAPAYSAWVQTERAVVGPQLVVLRADPAVIDPWFLAGCLKAPSNARQADTHTSTSSRIDVRRLQVLSLPMTEQRRVAEISRTLAEFEQGLVTVCAVGATLRQRFQQALLSWGAVGSAPRSAN